MPIHLCKPIPRNRPMPAPRGGATVSRYVADPVSPHESERFSCAATSASNATVQSSRDALRTPSGTERALSSEAALPDASALFDELQADLFCSETMESEEVMDSALGDIFNPFSGSDRAVMREFMASYSFKEFVQDLVEVKRSLSLDERGASGARLRREMAARMANRFRDVRSRCERRQWE